MRETRIKERHEGAITMDDYGKVYVQEIEPERLVRKLCMFNNIDMMLENAETWCYRCVGCGGFPGVVAWCRA